MRVLLFVALLLATACGGAPPAAPTRAAAPTQAAMATQAAAPTAAAPATAAPTAAATPQAQTTTAASPTSAAVVVAPAQDPAFSGVRAKAHVDAFAGQIGTRPAGSPGHAAAVQYASDQLRTWGYQPSLQGFPMRTYQDRGARLAVTQGGSSTLAADTLQYSPAGKIDAPLVAAGLGAPDDFAGVDARGKLVLLRRGTLRFAEKVANAASAGAVGVVVANDQGGRVQGSLGSPAAIPSVTISADDGRALEGLLAAGPVALSLEVDASVESRPAENVIAEKLGSNPVAGTIVIGAHLDSVPAGPGANDNASGSASVLELARAFAGRDYPFTVRFVLFDAEELGLFGSQYYVESLSPVERRGMRAMINLDMVGVGRAWRFGGDNSLVQEALGAATDLGVQALPLRGPVASSSDHASFMAAGIPSLFLYRVEDPNYHTAEDRPEHVDPDALDQAGTIALRVLESLAADA
jgi:aminopeptidase YwaD